MGKEEQKQKKEEEKHSAVSERGDDETAVSGVSSPHEENEVTRKAAEYDALWDKYLRLCAEFDNARKRWEKERQNLIKFAHHDLIKKLIVIVDELEQAKEAIKRHKTGHDIARGVELTYDNLLKILQKEGLHRVDARGKKFDPHLHEIVGQRVDESVDEHTVLEEVQKGYFLGDNLLRTAKVIISVKKNPSGEDSREDRGSDEGENNN